MIVIIKMITAVVTIITITTTGMIGGIIIAIGDTIAMTAGIATTTMTGVMIIIGIISATIAVMITGAIGNNCKERR